MNPWVSLFSGGKDSSWALYRALEAGKPVERLVTVHPTGESFMYHVPATELASLAAESIGLPLVDVRPGDFEVDADGREDSAALLNLPFGVVAIGLVVRGFTGYFLERAGVFASLSVPPVAVGPISVEGFVLSIWSRLAAYVAAGILVSFLGVAFASRMNDAGTTPGELPE